MQLIALQTLQALQKISRKNIALHIALQKKIYIAHCIAKFFKHCTKKIFWLANVQVTASKDSIFNFYADSASNVHEKEPSYMVNAA
jgi:hypothetical protein